MQQHPQSSPAHTSIFLSSGCTTLYPHFIIIFLYPFTLSLIHLLISFSSQLYTIRPKSFLIYQLINLTFIQTVQCNRDPVLNLIPPSFHFCHPFVPFDTVVTTPTVSTLYPLSFALFFSCFRSVK
jgi:hypothetical protein